MKQADLIEALEWYANEKNHKRPSIHSSWGVAPYFKDRGTTAQNALKQLEGK